MSAEQKALVVKRPLESSSDDDVVAAALPKQKTGLLPTGLSRAIVIGSIIVSCSLLIPELIGQRFALVPAAKSENALIYRIDRLTGHVSLCSTAQCARLSEKDIGG